MTASISDVLLGLNESMAAGFMELPDASPMGRWSRAVRRRFEHRGIQPYEGTLLYPAGPKNAPGENAVLFPGYSYTWQFNADAWQRRCDSATDVQRAALEALKAEIDGVQRGLWHKTCRHTVGGSGYTHSVPNYGRVIREGLNEHERRIDAGLATARGRGDAERIDFYEGLLDVVAGIRSWHGRLLDYLREQMEAGAEPLQNLKQLVAAYERVPFEPASTFFEAIVAYNFTFYLDDCDNPGRVDQELRPYYERDSAAGHTSHQEAVKLVRCLWENTDANSGWSAGIGGSGPDGGQAYSDLTVVCLEAARSIRRPNLQLHIRRDMPDEVWEACIDTLATGCGLPALHNEEEFLRSLWEAHLGIREEDLAGHNGGGCTETMIHGCSNVGSLDAGINLPLILVETLDAHLSTAGTFDDLLAAYKADVAGAVAGIAADVSRDQEAKARLRPQPVRSLLIDDCIDAGREFNAGGARYNWSVINIAGLANVADSLAAVQEVVFERKERTGSELIEALHADFEGAEPLRQRLERCPRFGNDQPPVDVVAESVAEFVFREFLRYAPWRGGKFLGSCLMFTTYATAGEPVGATPDGRRAGAPLADSAGPVQGRDRHGPTAMIKSVTKIPHYLAPGTLVVNARFAREFFATSQGRQRLRQLVRTYFDLGGMQIQINVVDQEVLRAAIARPEEHEDLIVRVGGYSEYFNRLSLALKEAILERTEHEAAR